MNNELLTVLYVVAGVYIFFNMDRNNDYRHPIVYLLYFAFGVVFFIFAVPFVMLANYRLEQRILKDSLQYKPIIIKKVGCGYRVKNKSCK